MPRKNICLYGENSAEVAEKRICTNLSNSTREAIQDCAACAKHNTLRIEIHTKDSDQPAARPERNVADKALLDFSSSMHERNKYQDSKDQAKCFYQHREWCLVPEVLFLCSIYFDALVVSKLFLVYLSFYLNGRRRLQWPL
jgi:hypothetical protein